MKKLLILGPVAFLFGLSVVGCSNTAEGAKEDASNAGQAVSKATDTAVDNTKEAAHNAAVATKNAADNAGQAISQTAEDAKDATKHAAKNTTAALEVTPRVKLAITADSELNNTKNLINVDSADNIVHLKGHVMTKEMKNRASELAKKTLSDSHSTDKVSNELTVQP